MILSKYKETTLYWILLSIIIIIASYYRLVGLGNWGFSSSDEYYIAKTGQNILKYGLPQFETGGYYTRGVLYEYLSVLLLSLGVKDVISYRLISVIFNLLSIPPLYLLVRKISNNKVAVLSVILFLFSALEIEFARLARFYTAFQAFFLWYLYVLYRVIVENFPKYKKWLFLISFASIFVYEGSIFLVVLNFLIFLYLNKISIKDIIYTSTIFIFAVFYLKTDFRNFGVTNYLPLDISLSDLSNSGGIVQLPKILLFTFEIPSIWLFLFLVPLLFSLYSILKIKEGKFVFNISLALIVVFSLLNQFGLVFYFSLLLLLSPYYKREYLFSKRSLYLSGSIIANFIFWVLYSLNTTSWYRFFPNLDSLSIKKIAWLFFNYPDVYQPFLLPWLEPLPIQSIITFLVIAVLLFSLLAKGLEKKETESLRFLFLVLIVLVLGICTVITPYYYARYSFFIYPIILALIPISINYFVQSIKIIKKIQLAAIISFVLLFLFVAEDFNANHILNINSKQIHFKEGFNKKLTGMYYYREDYETPAEIINKNASENDIIITTQETIDYYLSRLDYFYKPYYDKEFYGRSRNQGKTEIWSNANLVYTEKNLKELLENNEKVIWLITFSNKRYYVSKLEQELNIKYIDFLFYKNLNNTINVFRIPANKEK